MITVEDIIRLREQREDYLCQLHKEQKLDNNFYELKFDAAIPKGLGYEQRIPPTARDWVDQGIMHFTLDNPKAFVPPLRDSDAARKQAAKLGAFYNFWLRQIIRQIKENAKKLLIRGECFWKLWIDDRYYGIEPSKMTEEEQEEHERTKALHFPLLVETPDPLNVFPSPIEHDFMPADVIEYYGKTAAEVHDLCKRNNWKWESGKTGSQVVQWTVYYSNEYRCLLADDKPLLTPAIQPNWLGVCPYIHVPSGYGQTSYEGKPEYMYRSIIYRVRDMIKTEARAFSQTDAINARYAWPWPKISGDADLIKEFYGPSTEGITLSPDHPIIEPQVGDRKVTFDIIQGQQPPPGLFEYTARISALAQPPPVMQGYNPVGVHSGVQAEGLIGTAKPRYKDSLKYHELGLAKLLGLGAQMLETIFKDDITVRTFTEGKQSYETIKPSDIKGHYYCEVELLAEPPEALDVRKSLGANLQDKVISHRTNLIKYQNMTPDEADDEQTQMLAEQVIKQPNLQQVMGIDAMKRLGMEETLQTISQESENLAHPTTELGTESVRRLRRKTPGFESIETPREREVANMPIGR